MHEDLARSVRPTARGGWLRPRSRFAPGPLRPGRLRHPAPGIVRGMITGALLAIGVLTAFTLPFLRDGSNTAAPAAIAASLAPTAAPVQAVATRP
ncbi:hypothetical protein [Methylobacterium symbioticum]|uniref:Uncharacterized protein n=1 Tax=Methylobacterium symbioticum TaxID=2584084 RepID=A0A509E9Y5_9HYPH|nr:hypothetical protein [Methylobacterium symbioticum]VUD71011.1 hypothetical protein MET9862_01585 [Methylobacterium symbioticum]